MGRKKIKKITRSAFLTTEEQHLLQQELLIDQASYWLKQNNFFKQRLNDVGIYRPEDFKLDLLQSIPTCTKATISEHLEEIITKDIRIADFCTTSGSTGNPMTVPLTHSDIERLALNESLSFISAGIGKNDILMLCTTVDRTFMAGLAYLEGARKLKIPMVRAGIDNPAAHWDYINRFGVTAMIAVPSYIIKLLAYAEEACIDPNQTSVKKIICIGEPIRDAENNTTPVAKKINQLWDVKLYFTYASTEMQTAFTDCEYNNGGHHIPGLIIAEFLDEKGIPVKEGEPGELTITHLGVEGLPLLRFRTGDICKPITEKCKCGRESLRIQTVISRKNDLIKFKGTTIYPSMIIQLLNPIKAITDFIVIAEKDEYGHDLLSIWVNSLGNDNLWKSEVEAMIRVKPQWLNVTQEVIEEVRNKRPSRKLLKFIDLR